MHASARFREIFKHRIGSALGLSALLMPAIYACSGEAVIDGSSGGGGASSGPSSQAGGPNGVTTGGGCTESSTTGGGPIPRYHYTMCLDELNTPCPQDEAAAEMLVQQVFEQECCVNFDSCERLLSVDCGPFVASDGQCCFEVTTEEAFCATPGRPFTAGGQALVSALAATDVWLVAIGDVDCEGLPPAERERLAATWAREGLAEHASIASFARFALQLMAVGAPADLVAAAQRAALDEVEHARLAFALASRYAGQPMGPGAFPVGAGAIETSLAELAVATVEDGCINETLSTLRAREQLARTTDPTVHAVLARIIEDETRHAELAWQTVAWALRTGGADVREAVAAAFARVEGSADAGIRDVVGPCATALLAA